MRCGTIGSCQSVTTSEIVQRCSSRVQSCKWRYSKCPDLYLFTFIRTESAFGVLLQKRVVYKSAFIIVTIIIIFISFWPTSTKPVGTKTL